MSRNQKQNQRFSAANIVASDLSRPEDFLSPEQRLDAIAEILVTIGLRAMKESSNAALDEADPV